MAVLSPPPISTATASTPSHNDRARFRPGNRWLIASMISFTGFALGLISGTIGDRIGQRFVLIIGPLTIAAGSLIGAFAVSANAMLLSRFIEGIGFSASTVAGAGIITHVTSTEDRKWALGVWSSYVPIGFAGMLIGGALILNISDWRALWLANAMLTVFWAALAFSSPMVGVAAATEVMETNYCTT